MRRLIPLTLIGICLACCAAACSPGSSSSHEASSAQPAGSHAGGTAEVMTVLRQWARCVRSHGAPGMPDPIINPVTSYPDFPQDAPRVPASAQQACQSIASRLPPQAQSSQPPTAHSMRGLLRFARCMRSHGVTGWPDPNVLGEFPVTQQMAAQLKGLDHPAITACISSVPGGSQYLQIVAASAAQPAPGAAGHG